MYSRYGSSKYNPNNYGLSSNGCSITSRQVLTFLAVVLLIIYFSLLDNAFDECMELHNSESYCVVLIYD